MTGVDDPSSAAFFDEKYRSASDPWQFTTDPYELGRYQAIVRHVDPARHHRVFEPGCSVGVLTEMLAARCPEVHATDISAHAVRHARQRCAHHPGASITVGGVHPPPGDNYDLIVFSEIGYYLTIEALRCVVAELVASVDRGGRLIAAHWIGTSADHRLHGDDVHEVLARELASWHHRSGSVHRDDTRDGYRLDVWDRP